jgi:hypothetical protein
VVLRRLGVSLDKKVTVAIVPPAPGSCGSRGSTMVAPAGSEEDSLPLILVFADDKTDTKQILGVLAHELGHVLEYVVVNPDQSIQSVFLEGFATWAAGPYWLAWQGETSFSSAVGSYLADGSYLPLHETDGGPDTLGADGFSKLGQACLKRRDIIYTEWAAFIEYLVEEQGREKLYSLFRTPPLVSDAEESPFGRPNFPAVYGSSLERLETAWLESITVND